MSDDEDCVGLPMIFVNLPANDAGSFSIPSAEELATQRSRDDENERKLRELRERSDDADAAVARQDSGSSEGDAALSAAVTALCVGDAPAPRRHPRPAALLAAWPGLARRLPEAVRAACALVAAEGGAWADDDVAGVGALLAAAVLSGAAPRAPALRALHALLEARASPDQGAALVRALLRELDARGALELSDAVRAGGGPRSAQLASLAVDAALEALAGAGWAHVAEEARYAALQLLGRRLAGGARPPPAAALEPLALLAPPPRQRAHRQDRLKVLVAASKLRLLFGADE